MQETDAVMRGGGVNQTGIESHSHLFLPQKLLHWPIALLVRVCWSVQAQIWLFFGLIIRRKRHDNDLPKSQGRGIAA